MLDKIKRYAVSSFVTFLAGFGMALAPFLNDLTLEKLKSGGLFGLLFIGVRGGLKLLVEAFLVWYRNQK